MYARDLNEPKYEYLIKKREDAGIKLVYYPTAFIECSNALDDVYEKINDYNSNGRKKVLIFFEDMIANNMKNRRF